MPHQCLKCGKTFEEGSSQLLKGCPSCNGNRFFFTKTPLDEDQRQKITEEVGKDINSVILELMGDEGEKLVDKSGKWANIKPKDLRKAMQKHLPDKKYSNSDKKEEIDVLTDDEFRKKAIEKIKAEIDYSDSPETIDVEQPGSYKIDLKGLLEEEPIIIQKDGSYNIHLPSLFKNLNRDKEK
jgi:predicted  nucleic acid-binding Zn-ribbon protein